MKYLAFCIFIGCFLACSQKPVLPIPEEKMAVILKEMLMAEAAMNRVNRSDKDSIEMLYYNQIYQIHEVDSTSLANSFKMMQDDPVLSKSIYDQTEKLLEEVNKGKEKVSGEVK